MRPLLRICETALEVLAGLRARTERTHAGRRRALGEAGERRAYFHLRRNGYVIVARQWRAPNVDGEIDLIAWHGDTLCFIEVKTRGKRDRFAPERAIGATKERALRRMLRAYVRGLFDDAQALPAMRIDVVTVLRLRRDWRITVLPAAVALSDER